MEPPKKRRRWNIDNAEDLQSRKVQNDLRLKSTFEAIFEKYGKDFSDVGDEVDLVSGKIVVNNGHLLSMQDALDDDGYGIATDEPDKSDYSDPEHTDNDFDELWSLEDHSRAFVKKDFMDDDKDSLIGDIREPENGDGKEISSETDLVDPLSSFNRDVHDALSKEFNSKHTPEQGTSGWLQKPGFPFQPLAPHPLHPHFRRGNTVETQKTKTSNASNPLHPHPRGENVIVMQKTGTETKRRRRLWSKEEQDLVIHLKTTTDLMYKQMVPRFTGRSPSSIQNLWSRVMDRIPSRRHTNTARKRTSPYSCQNASSAEKTDLTVRGSFQSQDHPVEKSCDSEMRAIELVPVISSMRPLGMSDVLLTSEKNLPHMATSTQGDILATDAPLSLACDTASPIRQSEVSQFSLEKDVSTRGNAAPSSETTSISPEKMQVHFEGKGSSHFSAKIPYEEPTSPCLEMQTHVESNDPSLEEMQSPYEPSSQLPGKSYRPRDAGILIVVVRKHKAPTTNAGSRSNNNFEPMPMDFSIPPSLKATGSSKVLQLPNSGSDASPAATETSLIEFPGESPFDSYQFGKNKRRSANLAPLLHNLNIAKTSQPSTEPVEYIARSSGSVSKSHGYPPNETIMAPVHDDDAFEVLQDFDRPSQSAKSSKQVKAQSKSRLLYELQATYGDLSDDELSLPLSTVSTPVSRKIVKVRKPRLSYTRTMEA